MGTCHNPHHQHPEHPGQPPPDIEAMVDHAVKRVREQGMRRTRILVLVLRELARRGGPATVAEMGEALGDDVDPATLYRMVERLLHVGVVRRVGLHDRAQHVELVIPGRHRDYLICTECGAVGEIIEGCPVGPVEAHLAKRTGYRNLRHELLFYGTCPECRGGKEEG